jgi:hypothetical protein
MVNPRILATPSTHQACGPMRFGMKGAELQKASTQLRAVGQGKITAATLRQWLVTNGVKHPARLAERDHAIRLEMRYTVGQPLSQLVFQSHGYYPAAEYESVVKPAWETLQDVADSKFDRVTRKAQFPPLTSVRKSGKAFVSDTWEVDRIRVEIGIHAVAFYGEPAMRYAAVLTVTDPVARSSAK